MIQQRGDDDHFLSSEAALADTYTHLTQTQFTGQVGKRLGIHPLRTYPGLGIHDDVVVLAQAGATPHVATPPLVQARDDVDATPLPPNQITITAKITVRQQYIARLEALLQCPQQGVFAGLFALITS